jgi:murein DD-endopeptidase MepM/ murein hydrolase activator NlpD
VKFRLSSEFGELSPVRDHPHHGIDFAMPEGTELRSVFEGVVERVVDFGNENLGKGVFIRHDDGTLSIYGHLKEISVKPGEHVDAGELIGLSGNTGHSTGPHLHFAMKDANGNWLDPTPIAEKVSDTQGGLLDWFLQRGQVGNYSHADTTVWDWLATNVWTDVKAGLIDLAHALTGIMPEIGAAITVICGIGIMVTGNFPKWFARWGFGMTGVILWIIGVR